MKFGEYFRDLRKSKRLTQEDIASKIGKSKMLVSGIETGRNGAFVDEDLEKIAVAFRLSSDEKSKLFYEASRARDRIPIHLLNYMNNHDEVYCILEIMAQEQMGADLLGKIKVYVEELKNATNN